MRFLHLFSATVSSLTLAFAALPAHAAPPQTSCAQHSDCGNNAYCNKGICTQLGQLESFMSLSLTQPTAAPAYFFLDGANMGSLPWEGIVQPGLHTMHVESQGMLPLDLQGTSSPGTVDLIPLTLQPLDGADAPIPQEIDTAVVPAATEQTPNAERGVPGTFYVAALGGLSAGTAFMTDLSRPATTLLVGGSAGLRLPKIPIFIDLGLAASGTFTKLGGYHIDGKLAGFGDFVKLDLGLLARVLFPLKKNFFYLGGEIEPGFAISNQNYIYAGVRVALSIFPSEVFEIRINPAGAEFIQGLAKEKTGFIISYQATIGIAIRFPK
jgi:hypothetical protein